MNTRSLKFRLVVWYAGSLTVLFIVFALFSYAGLRFQMEKSLREALTRRVRQIAATSQRLAPDWKAFPIEIQNHFAPEVNNRFTRVTIDGVVRYVSGLPADGGFDPSIVPTASSEIREEVFERRTLPDGSGLFVVVLPKLTTHGWLVAEEGFSAEPIDTALHDRVVGLSVGLAMLIAVATIGGLILVHRALAPVDQIIDSAEQISSRNLGERLPVPQTGDELERLSVSLNEMIRRLEEAVQQNQRFLADASHELRTPLTILQGELETVADSAGGKSDGNGIGRVISSSLEEVERLKKIVEALFALSRLDAGEAQEEAVPVNLGELADLTAEQMCLLAEDKGITITRHCAPQVIVSGDRARLKQVIVNLLDNAIKYTPRNGTVEISVFPRGSSAILEVVDDGMGIPPEAQARVFDRFFRVDKARSRDFGGAGLGLSIVKSICLAHAGKVELHSEPGRGSRFIVELPLDQTRT